MTLIANLSGHKHVLLFLIRLFPSYNCQMTSEKSHLDVFHWVLFLLFNLTFSKLWGLRGTNLVQKKMGFLSKNISTLVKQYKLTKINISIRHALCSLKHLEALGLLHLVMLAYQVLRGSYKFVWDFKIGLILENKLETLAISSRHNWLKLPTFLLGGQKDFI